MANGKTICTVCNYIFDESIGESRQGIPAAVKFEDLPDNWSCPECASSKDMFQTCSCVGLPVDVHSCVPQNNTKVGTNARSAAMNSMAGVSVGQLVAERPSRACVLEQYNIDYCCGGKKTLAEACEQKGLQLAEVVEKLVAADQKEVPLAEPDWTKTSMRKLIEHIVTSYHRPLREELPRLMELAEKVAKVHGDNHPELAEVHAVFKSFKEQLELHMEKEEMILFPGIAGIEAGGSRRAFGSGGSIEHPITMMMQEHDDAGEAISTMRRLTNNYTPPADACNTFKTFLYSLAKLEAEMHQHVHKENNILFPRALSVAIPAASSR